MRSEGRADARYDMSQSSLAHSGASEIRNVSMWCWDMDGACQWGREPVGHRLVSDWSVS